MATGIGLVQSRFGLMIWRLPMLKLAWNAALLTVGLVHTGSWKQAVLDQWSVNCASVVHPPPYPFELRRLANGEPTWQGVRQFFTCAPDPEWELFLRRVKRRG